jgi:hypothetical protein
MSLRCDEHASRLTAIESRLDALRDAIGEAPDASVGSPGFGMAGVLVSVHEAIERVESGAERARIEADARVRTIKVIAAAVTAVATTIAGVVTAFTV